MSEGVWKLGTLVFAGTTLALTLVLVLDGQPETAPLAAPNDARTPVTNSDESPAEEREPVTRRHAAVAPPQDREEPVAPDAEDEARRWLTATDVREVLYLVTLSGTGDPPVGGITFELLMERLRRDESEAVEILDDWVGRYRELDNRDVNAQAWLFDAYAELRGEAAIPALRAAGDRSRTLAALIRAGATEEIEELDEEWRSGSPRSVEAPFWAGRAGPNGLRYLREWVASNDPPPERDRRARLALWMVGTQEDAERLWSDATPLQRLNDYVGGRADPGGTWLARMRDECERLLGSDDPWIRMHAARRVLSRHVSWKGELRHAALERSRIDAQLPNPGGHDQDAWDELQKRLQHFVEAADRQAARRRLLGLE